MRQHGKTTSPKGTATRREGRRGKFPSSWERCGGPPELRTHGTTRVIDKAGRRKANKASWARESQRGRDMRRALRALEAEDAR